MPAKKATAKKKTATKGKKVAKKKPAAKKPAAKTVAKAAPKEKKTESTPKPRRTPSLVRGMKDIEPRNGWLWQEMFQKAAGIATAYGFDYGETPILEEASLFVRSLGRSSDVVGKEMYVFEDRDGSKLALRPEWTAAIARSYITHGMHTLPQPVKVWTIGSMFRHDRPQAGRYRQFHQFDCETIGSRDAAVDAELISVAYHFVTDLGIKAVARINSIGTPADRERYLVELVAYLRSKRSYLSDDSKRRINKNPLRVLDSKDEKDQPVIEDAPQIIDWLAEDSKAYFMKVIEYLDELEIPYVLDPTLVRGLDYYTDTVFEIYQEDNESGSQSALGGGGRYDLLVEQLGGQPTPACGFAMGLERIFLAKRKMLDPHGEGLKKQSDIKVFFAHLGEQARRRVLALIEGLRKEGIMVHHNIARTSLKGQLELANKFGATHAIILGQKELQDGTAIIRDMTSGIQEIIDQNKLKKEIQKITG